MVDGQLVSTVDLILMTIQQKLASVDDGGNMSALCLVLTLIMQSFLENAKIGEIQYLCDEDECWYICRSITATFRKCIISWSQDIICINLHMTKKCKFLVDVLVVILHS